MDQSFFTEERAMELREQEILIVSIPQVKARKIKQSSLDLELILPSKNSEQYTNTREGRIILETKNQTLIQKIIDLKPGENYQDNNTVLRGMAGGIAYTYNESLILQSKFYPKSGDRYFSIFSGLSSSIVDIQDPRRIVLREGIEELLIFDNDNKTIYSNPT